MVIHHVDKKNVEILEGIFAYLTPEGWKSPDWLVLMRETIQHKGR